MVWFGLVLLLMPWPRGSADLFQILTPYHPDLILATLPVILIQAILLISMVILAILVAWNLLIMASLVLMLLMAFELLVLMAAIKALE